MIKRIIKIIITLIILLSITSCTSYYGPEDIVIDYNYDLLNHNYVDDKVYKNNKCEVRLVESPNIDSTNRCETIIGVQFFYEPNQQMVVIKNDSILTLKEGFCDLLITDKELYEIKNEYNAVPKKNGIQYYELKDKIVYEEKKIVPEENFYFINEYYGMNYSRIIVTVSECFKIHEFTIEDFPFDFVNEISNLNLEYFYSFDLKIDVKDQDLKYYIECFRKIERLYFVKKVDIDGYSILCNDYIDQFSNSGEKESNLYKAWDLNIDCSNVTIGIIDSGIDGNHPDLQ